jgi:DNA-binding response OmpR family regulator
VYVAPYSNEGDEMSNETIQVSGKRKAKVLVIDDEHHIVMLVRVNLEHAGFEVIWALEGKTGLADIICHKPDLVVLDIQMPYLNGWEVLQAVRENTDTKDIPIIILSQFTKNNETLKKYGADCTYFMSKPFSPPQLLQLIPTAFAKIGMNCEHGYIWPATPE